MTIRLLLIEDHLQLVPGLRADLEGGEPDSAQSISVLDRVLTTVEDAIAFFEGAARRGEQALRDLPVDVVLVDDLLPRHGGRNLYPEHAAVEIAIRITRIYDSAGIAEEDRPLLVLNTTDPDPCDIRAFIAYGGADVLQKALIPGDELRSRIAAIVGDGRRWEPPAQRPLHQYLPGFTRYLRGIELGVSTADVAIRINAVEGSVARTKNNLRHAFGLPARASDGEIVETAKRLGITWVPLKYEDLAKTYGVRSRLELW